MVDWGVEQTGAKRMYYILLTFIILPHWHDKLMILCQKDNVYQITNTGSNFADQ